MTELKRNIQSWEEAMNKLATAVVSLGLILVLSSVAVGLAPLSFSYQGTLSESGTPVTGSRDVWFAIYNVPSSGTPIWKEFHSGVAISAGVFSVYVGQGNHTADGPLTYDKFDDTTRYLAFSIGSTFETATEILRTRMASVPFATRVGTVEGAVGGQIYGPTSIYTSNASLVVDQNCVTLNPSYTSPDVGLYVPKVYNTPDWKTGVLAYVNNLGAGRAIGVSSTATSDGEAAVGFESMTYSDQGGWGVMSRMFPKTPNAPTGDLKGVYGATQYGQFGVGVYGEATNAASNGIGVYGKAIGNGGNNFGGYFIGDGYFSGNLGVGTAAPTAKLHIAGTPGVDGIKFPDGTLQVTAAGAGAFWSLTGNSATTPGTNYLGTADNQPLEIKVNNNRALRIEPKTNAINIIGGYSGNAIDAPRIGATISGGGQPGQTNRIANDFGTIGGGDSNFVSAGFGTVGGGHGNIASGGSFSYPTVAGGLSNSASGYAAAVTGGTFNVASGDRTSLGGGRHNMATRGMATVAGGNYNTASDTLATVGGGQFNIASGAASTVPGGDSCTADGNYSFAAGRHAKALDHGSFVWADNQAADFASSGANQFLIRASGGVGISNVSPGVAPSAALDVDVSATSGLRAGEFRNNSGGGGVGIAALTAQNTNASGIAFYAESFTTDATVIATNTTAAGAILKCFGTGFGVKFRVNGNGNVGINTDAPTQALHVVGNICATGTIGVCSDKRYKTDVETISGALGQIEKLRGVNYNWRRDDFPQNEFPDGNQIGFIAQEVAEIIPSVVSQGADGYYSVDYGRLTPLLVEAIKQLKSDNDKLLTKVSHLSELEAEVAELKAIVKILALKQETQMSDPISLTSAK